MKYDSTGAVMWTSQQGSSGTDEAFGVALSVGGYVYVTGGTSGELKGQINKGK